MIELQFRVLSEIEGKKCLSMVENLHWDFTTDQLVAKVVDSKLPCIVSPHDLMPYTGIKDKHNNPIFVNDIVQVKYSPEIFDPEITKKGVVIYRDGFLIQTRQQDFLSLDVFENLEKIGDIYHDSELLLPPKPTYGDKLRGMSNKEIAKFLFDTWSCLGERYKTEEGFTKFLEQEVIKEDL